MLTRLLLLACAPLFVVAIIIIGAGLALQLAFGSAFDAIAGCTQWTAKP
jgi:hypothetical protein